MSHLTAVELATRWHMTPAWVRTLAASKQIPGAIRAGTRWRFPLESVEAWEARHTVRDPMTITERSKARAR